MADWDFVLVPTDVSVEFQVNQVVILLNSMQLLGSGDIFSGLDNFLMEMAHSFSDEQMRTHRIVFHHFGDMIEHTETQTFPDLIAYLQTADATTLRDKATDWMDTRDDSPGRAALMADADTYIDYLRSHYVNKGKDPDEHLDIPTLREVHALMQQPEALIQRTVTHLQWIWDEYLAEEWRKREAALHESAKAFSQMSYTGMDSFEIVEAITGRDMRTFDYFAEKVKDTPHLIFMPSPHVGPYIGFWPVGNERLYLFFRMRQPDNSQFGSSALKRPDLLVRLNALADDTRLQMVELLHEHEELCAQDFIEKLELSQSSASRHLRQLAASGFLTVRRRDTAKCYALNDSRIEDTLKALTRFLHG